MSKLTVNIKKLNNDAVIPSYAKHGDAGMDLTATSVEADEHGNVVYGTGIAIEIPSGYVGLLFPRSSNAKKDLILSNSVGVIDSGYRGEILMKFKEGINAKKIIGTILSTLYKKLGIEEQETPKFSNYEKGDRIGQVIIMPVPTVQFNEVDELSNSDRGIGGFGSTDPITGAIEENYEPK